MKKPDGYLVEVEREDGTWVPMNLYLSPLPADRIKPKRGRQVKLYRDPDEEPEVLEWKGK